MNHSFSYCAILLSILILIAPGLLAQEGEGEGEGEGENLSVVDAISREYTLFTEDIYAGVEEGGLSVVDALSREYTLFTEDIYAGVEEGGLSVVDALSREYTLFTEDIYAGVEEGGMPVVDAISREFTLVWADPQISLLSPTGLMVTGQVSIAWEALLVASENAIHAVLAITQGIETVLTHSGANTGSLVWDSTAHDDGHYQLEVTFWDGDEEIETLTKTILVNNGDLLQLHSGTIEADETWSADYVHIVSGEFIIASGACVAIEPGAIVKFEEGASIYVEEGGCLDAQGTEDLPIIFTSLADDSIGGDTNIDDFMSLPGQGDWDGIGGPGSITLNDYAELRYMTFTHSGSLDRNDLWRGHIVHHVTGDIVVPSGVVLTILPGAIVKFNPGLKLIVESGGELVASGQTALPIIFTSVRDDAFGGDTNADGDATWPDNGDWLGLTIAGEATFVHTRLQYMEGVESGPYSTWAGLVVDGGYALIQACDIAHGIQDGVAIGFGGGTLRIENSTITDFTRGAWIRTGHAFLINSVVDDCTHAIHNHGGSTTIENSALTNFVERGVWHDLGGSVEVRNTNVYSPTGTRYDGSSDQTGLNGNISTNPLYYDAETNDYRLRPGSPLIDAADGDAAPEVDYYGVPRFDDPHVPNTGTPTPSGAYADIGAFENAEEAESDIDLAVRYVGGPASAQVGDEITIEYEVVNLGTQTATGAWRDALYLQSANPALGARRVGLGEVTQQVNLPPNTAAQFSSSVVLPAAEPGEWHLGVQVNTYRDIFEGTYTANNDLLSTNTMDVSVLSVAVDTTQAGTLGAGESITFQLTQPAGEALMLLLSGGGGVVIRVAFGRVPTAGSYDLTASAGEPLILPANSSEREVYIVIENTGSTDADYSVTPTAYTFSLLSIGAYQGSDLSVSMVPLLGAGFTDGMQATLTATGGGASIPAATVTVMGVSEALASFDLRGATAGLYDVTVQSGEDASTLPEVFTIVHNAVPRLEARIVMPDSVRAMRKYVAWLEYENAGDGDLNAPYFTISSPRDDVLLALSPDAPYQSGAFEVLGLGPEHPVSVLRPGDQGRIPVYFRTPASVTGGVRIEFSIATETDELVPWDEVGANIRPDNVTDEAWAHILNNLIGQMGSSWYEMISTLRYDADYLSQFGQSTNTVRRLFNFEVMKARGVLGGGTLASMTDLKREARRLPMVLSRTYPEALDARFQSGCFGRGWVFNHDYRLDTRGLPDTLHIVGPGGGYRSFTSGEGYWQGAQGDPASLEETPDGFLLTEQDGWTYVFNAAGRLVSIAEPNGHSMLFTYSAGCLTGISHSDGQHLALQYHGGHVSSVHDDLGRSATYEYQGEFLTSVTFCDGRTVQYDYEDNPGMASDGSLASITYPDAAVQYVEYDGCGRLAASWWDDGIGLSSFAYMGGGAVDFGLADGTYHYYYGEHGQLLKTVDPLGNHRDFEYDPETIALTRIWYPDRSQASLERDANGQPVAGIDQLGHRTQFAYTQPYGSFASFLDARGNQTSYTYDVNDNMTGITYPDGSMESWTYNANGDALSWTNRRGQTITYSYDGEGRLTGKNWPDGRTFTYGYDNRGNLTSATDSITGVITLSYDANDYMTRIEYADGRWLEFEYDAAGRRTRRKDLDGFELHYTHDDHGRLFTLKDKLDSLFIRYTYDDYGRLAREDKGNGTYTTYTYDAAGQILLIEHRAPDDALQQKFAYTYDENGHRTSMTTQEGRHEYAYDLTGQLTDAIYPNGDEFHYTYDPLGNRITATEGGVTEEYITNGLNQYTRVGSRTCRYDLAGNLIEQAGAEGTRTYTYDVENRLVAVQHPDGSEWSCQFDALGNRIRIVASGRVADFLFDPIGMGNIVAMYSGGNESRQHYIAEEWLVAQYTESADWWYYGFDGTANSRLTTNASGGLVEEFAYDPFGRLREGDSGNLFRFSGGLGALTGPEDMLLLRRRVFLHSLGRFTACDSIGLLGGDTNFYRYAANNTLSYVDPTGYRSTLCEETHPKATPCKKESRNDMNRRLMSGNIGDFSQELYCANKKNTATGQHMQKMSEAYEDWHVLDLLSIASDMGASYVGAKIGRLFHDED